MRRGLAVGCATWLIGGFAWAQPPEPEHRPVGGVVSEPQGVALEDDTADRESRQGEAWARRPFAVELDLGIATPIGLGGVMLDVTPVRWWSIACGVGTNVVGVEVACMSRVRSFMTRETALNVGVGLSGGRYYQSQGTRYGALWPLIGFMDANAESPWPSEYRWERALWLNGEVGYESRHRTGTTFRAFFGLSRILNPDDWSAYPSGPDPGQHRRFERWAFVPYAGVAFGYAW